MMRHIAVSGWLLGPPSGANRRLLCLLRELGPRLRADERITVLHGRDFAPPTLPGIRWHAVPIASGPTWRRAFAERRVLPTVLRELGATLLDHGFLPLPRVPVPVCLLVHDLRAIDGLTRWPRWLATRALRSACERAAAVVAPSSWTATRLRALGKHVRAVDVVPNGVDLPPLPPPVAPATTTPAAATYVLHVGHVEPRKNLTVVVDALALLPAAARPQLWLAGHDAGALPSLRRRAAAKAVTLRTLGRVDEPTLATLYREARAVVLPSRHEGFGLPALEALAHGTPLLSSDAAALPEVVGAAAPLLSPEDPDAWAEAIVAAAAPAARAEGAVQRRRDHAANLGWSSPAERLLAVWRRLL